MTHPLVGQRNGKRPGPSSGGKVDMGVLATWMVFHFSIHHYWDHERSEVRLVQTYVRLADQGRATTFSAGTLRNCDQKQCHNQDSRGRLAD
jgi:hypothetical protein